MLHGIYGVQRHGSHMAMPISAITHVSERERTGTRIVRLLGGVVSIFEHKKPVRAMLMNTDRQSIRYTNTL
jgi:hypothetical protein